MTQFYKLFNCAYGCGKCDAEDDQKIVNDVEGTPLEDDEMENGAYRAALGAIRNSQPCGDSHIPDGHQCHAGQGGSASSGESTRETEGRKQEKAHEERYIASTVRDQIRAADRSAMMAWGSKDLTILPSKELEGGAGYRRGGLMFRVNGAKLGHGIVKVHLMGNDTYTVDTGKVRKGSFNLKARKSGIYAEDLMRTIDHMIERDAPGIGNRYAEVAVAIRNSGTSEGAQKGWETRRAGGDHQAVVDEARSSSEKEFPHLAKMSPDEVRSEIAAQLDRKPMDATGNAEADARAVLKETTWPESVFEKSGHPDDDTVQDVKWVRDFTAKAIASGDKAEMAKAVGHFNDVVSAVAEGRKASRRDKADAEFLASKEGRAAARGDYKLDMERNK